MASLKELRNRISSVQATQKITRAMQMVAASKLRKAQNSAEAARPYAEHMANVLSNLTDSIQGDDSVSNFLTGTGSEKVHLLVVVTAERGLCGGFNASIVNKALFKARELLDQGKTVKILCIGCKGDEHMQRVLGQYVLPAMNFTELKTIGFIQAEQISSRIISMFEANEFDICTLFYSEFVNVLTQNPSMKQLIPVQIDIDKSVEESTTMAQAIYDYEPEQSSLLDVILPRNITVNILGALLENAASEQGARMSAMDNATRNAGEMIDKLTIIYNRSRQAQITKELIEIISGAEAL